MHSKGNSIFFSKVGSGKITDLKKTYAEIENKTGASTATISRVNRSLNYGADGYKIVLKRMGIIDNK